MILLQDIVADPIKFSLDFGYIQVLIPDLALHGNAIAETLP
jgi:hypothetical protein